MKHLKLKVLAIVGLMFGLGLSVGLSEPAAAKTTSVRYTIWISGANKSTSTTANIVGTVAKVSCRNNGNGTNVVQVETDETTAPQLLSGLDCGEQKQEVSYGPSGSARYDKYYVNVRDIEKKLKDGGVGLYAQEAYLDFSDWNASFSVYGMKDSKATVTCVHVPTSGARDYVLINTQVVGKDSTETYRTSIYEECHKDEIKKKLSSAGFLVGSWVPDNGWQGEPDDPDPGDDDPKDPDPQDDDPNKDVDPNNGKKNTDPATPMTYGEVTNNASILINCDNVDKGNGEGIKCIINLVIDIMTIGVGILSVVGITVVGVQYLSAGGSEEKTRKAKRRMLEIVIGVALYVVAYAALKWLLPNFK